MSYVIVGNDEQDRVTSYTCDSSIVSIDTFIPFETPYVYELVYPCLDPQEDTIKDVSEKLLTAAATAYRILPPGNGCVEPPGVYVPGGARDEDEDMNWIGATYSLTESVVVPDYACANFMATSTGGECCVVVEGSLAFLPSGGYDEQEFTKFVASTLNRNSFSSGESFQTSFLAAAIDYTYSPKENARDQFGLEGEGGNTNVITGIGGNVQPAQADDSKVTVMGGALLSGLVVAALGVFFVIFRRRKNAHSYDDDDLEANTSKTDMGGMHNVETQETLQLDAHVLSDSVTRSHDHYNVDSPGQEYEYHFDLSNTMKNDVLSTYGHYPTSMAVVAPYPMSGEMSVEVSEDGSAADSWAQTDATVGSLEDRLGEITAEI
jgi:hypothetical protein